MECTAKCLVWVFDLVLSLSLSLKLFGCVGVLFRVVCCNKRSMTHLTNVRCEWPVGQGSSRSTAGIAGRSSTPAGNNFIFLYNRSFFYTIKYNEHGIHGVYGVLNNLQSKYTTS